MYGFNIARFILRRIQFILQPMCYLCSSSDSSYTIFVCKFDRIEINFHLLCMNVLIIIIDMYSYKSSSVCFICCFHPPSELFSVNFNVLQFNLLCFLFTKTISFIVTLPYVKSLHQRLIFSWKCFSLGFTDEDSSFKLMKAYENINSYGGRIIPWFAILTSKVSQSLGHQSLFWHFNHL